MPSFSQYSLDRLRTAHPDLQRLFEEVIKFEDCRVLCGHRTQAEQDLAFTQGKSRVQWPNSNHNKQPSLAVDVVPYPVRWDDMEGFLRFGSFVKGVAAALGIAIRWGGDWSDRENDGRPGWDAPHFELLKGGS